MEPLLAQQGWKAPASASGLGLAGVRPCTLATATRRCRQSGSLNSWSMQGVHCHWCYLLARRKAGKVLFLHNLMPFLVLSLFKSMQMQAGELAVADSMAGLPGGPAERQLGTLCYQIRAAHAGTGQIDMVLWPRLALRNELPFPVDFLLEQDPELTGQQQLQQPDLRNLPACCFTCRQPQCGRP